ncbi:hypothetical protein B0H13DRAFT_1886753 [Mycena leptocephala]|nr:hypothetical protein B0H13DRAFT_1886753 [Mycena leptocephala]
MDDTAEKGERNTTRQLGKSKADSVARNMPMAGGQSDGAADCGPGVSQSAAPASAPAAAPPLLPVGSVPSSLARSARDRLSILPLPSHRPLGSLILSRLPPGLATLAAAHATCDESRLAPHIDADAHAKQPLAGPTRRHPGAASAATHEHIFRRRAPMANLPVHPPRTADYQGHAAGGGKKGTERSDAGSSAATRGL